MGDRHRQNQRWYPMDRSSSLLRSTIKKISDGPIVRQTRMWMLRLLRGWWGSDSLRWRGLQVPRMEPSTSAMRLVRELPAVLESQDVPLVIEANAYSVSNVSAGFLLVDVLQ